LVEARWYDGQVVVFERLEVALRKLGLSRDLLEGQASMLTGTPEQCTNGNDPVFG
jgi:hypothetical protein